MCYAKGMEQEHRGRNYRTLGVVMVMALGYVAWLYLQHTITGSIQSDGAIGVLLGLFICSRPAANMLDMLFAQRSQSSSAEWASMGWLALNGLVLFIGWIVITIGATRLIDRSV